MLTTIPSMIHFKVGLNYIFNPISNYRLGFKIFFADENIFFFKKKLSVIYKKNNGIVFSCIF